MLCKRPFFGQKGVFGCCQCLPCRVNRLRTWTHRILLEQRVHDKSSFITLTYDNDHLPAGGTLVPRHAQLWLKRLRKAVAPTALRFFLVGEYGDESERPHYHAAVFGLGPEDAQIVEKTWGHGFVYVGDLSPDSAQYVAGYVTKKMTAVDDPRLNGRYPEFARMSLRPGIGATAVSPIVDSLTSEHGCNELAKVGDVPSQLLHGSKLMPLGRYMRRKIREKLFIPAEEAGALGLKKANERVRELLKEAREDPKLKGLPSEQIFVAKNAQKVLQLETRLKLYKKRGSL